MHKSESKWIFPSIINIMYLTSVYMFYCLLLISKLHVLVLSMKQISSVTEAVNDSITKINVLILF